MRHLSPAAVADAGLVRLGAGIRAPRPFPLPLASRPAGSLPARPAAKAPPVAAVPAAVADAGRVRLGAGIRRA